MIAKQSHATTHLHDLKPGWRRVRFGDVVHLNTERCADPAAEGIERYIGLEHLTPGDLTLRSWGQVAAGTTFTNRVRAGQVLFGKRRAYQRKVAVASFDAVCSSDIYAFESKDADVLLPALLPFLCQTERFFEHAVGTSAGSLSPRTNWTQLAAYEFALPPLAEQRRIAEVLESSVDVVKNMQELHTAAGLLWRSAAAEIFDGLSPQNSTCDWTRLGQCLSYSSDGPFGSKLKTEHYVPIGIRVIRLQNIQTGQFDGTDEAYVSEDYYRTQLFNYTVCPGDVLIAGLGDDRIPAGRACIFPRGYGTAVNKADCYCLRTNERLSSQYLVAFLNSEVGLRQSAAISQGTTRYRLNLGNIRRMKIPVPLQTKQKNIVDILSSIEDGRRTIGLKLSQSQAQYIHNLDLLVGA